MIDAKQKKEAKQNFDQYLQDGLIKKEKNETARAMYIKNAEQSLNLAEECMISPLRPHLWVTGGLKGRTQERQSSRQRRISE